MCLTTVYQNPLRHFQKLLCSTMASLWSTDIPAVSSYKHLAAAFYESPRLTITHMISVPLSMMLAGATLIVVYNPVNGRTNAPSDLRLDFLETPFLLYLLHSFNGFESNLDQCLRDQIKLCFTSDVFMSDWVLDFCCWTLRRLQPVWYWLAWDESEDSNYWISSMCI